MIANIILVAVALACVAGVEAVYYFLRSSSEHKQAELRRRLRGADETSPGTRLMERQGKMARNASLEPLVRGLPFSEQLEQLLQQTDLEWTVAGMLATSALVGVVAFGAGLAWSGGLQIALLFMVFGAATPVVYAQISRSKRSEVLSSQLPEALDMMVRSLRAGHSVQSAFRLVATESPVPVAVEFARCADEYSLGVDFRSVVENLTQRVPNNLDLKIFGMSLILQHDTGGNLVELLEQIAYTIRERYKFYGKVREIGRAHV
jgi:tight adherence protein B